VTCREDGDRKLSSTHSAQQLDAITFEVLRHRLEAFNDEACDALIRIAGSPIVTESFDVNSALMRANGEVVVCGNYALVHSPALNGMVEYVLENYSENPGIRAGDMFITNNPYISGRHQLDSVLVAPVYDGSELVAWVGNVLHQPDVGGPTPGSYSVIARSIYEEAIPMAPCKIVEAGTLRRDIEEEYLIRSRTRDLNRLDLLGQITANRLHSERILDLCAQYSRGIFLATLNRLLDNTEAMVRSRLRELPDGRWRHVGFMEHDGSEDKIYAVSLVMTKTGETLILDFTGSADQAPAVINAPIGTLRAFVLVALMALLGYDGIPWVPAAFERVIDLRTREGSVVHAKWPAGVTMSGTAAGQEARTVLNVCIARMLDASVSHSLKIMAPGITSAASQTIGGTTEDGRRFAGMALRGAGGAGAQVRADGADTAGYLHIPGAGSANIESTEKSLPILALWLRERTDSGGPGVMRGGVGTEGAFRPHRTGGEMTTTIFSHGVQQPEAVGVCGGEPGLQNGHLFLRGEAAHVTTHEHLRSATGHEVPPPKALLKLAHDDVVVNWYSGGGGYGDPLDRDPEMVRRDVEEGLVSPEGARRDYKVVLNRLESAGWGVDYSATTSLRASERRARLGGSNPVDLPVAELAGGRRVSGRLNLVGPEENVFACSCCGFEIGPADENVKLHLAVREGPISERWPHAANHSGSTRFVLRRYFCPGCATQLDVEVNLRGADPVWSVEPLLVRCRATEPRVPEE
jgi:N-methylhydantoinase B